MRRLESVKSIWEVFDPDGIVPVLYGDPCLVSACHAWSCTPCLFLQKKGSAPEIS